MEEVEEYWKLLAYLQYLTSRPSGFLVPIATGGLSDGEDPIRLVMCRLADDAAASVGVIQLIEI